MTQTVIDGSPGRFINMDMLGILLLDDFQIVFRGMCPQQSQILALTIPACLSSATSPSVAGMEARDRQRGSLLWNNRK